MPKDPKNFWRNRFDCDLLEDLLDNMVIFPWFAKYWAIMKGLLTKGTKRTFMRFSNQSMVGLATVICLLFQGYIFTYVLKVEPEAIVSIAPILPFVLYIYARNRRVWWSHKPIYWIAAIIALTMADIAPYALASNVLH
jgi:hypothetical protein